MATDRRAAGFDPPGDGVAPPAGFPVRPAYPVRARAGFWARFWALFLDGLIMAIPLGVMAAVLIFLFGVVGLIMYFLLSPVATILYFVYFEGGPRGQTPGKSALNIRVVSFTTGGPITRGTACARQLARILSGLVLDLGYLWMLWDPEKQTWHDKLAETIVVPVDAYPLS